MPSASSDRSFRINATVRLKPDTTYARVRHRALRAFVSSCLRVFVVLSSWSALVPSWLRREPVQRSVRGNVQRAVPAFRYHSHRADLIFQEPLDRDDFRWIGGIEAHAHELPACLGG